MSGTLRTTLGSAATAPRAAPSVADEEAPRLLPPSIPPGVARAWLSRADSGWAACSARRSGTSDATHGVRTCGEELDFAAETFLAEPELYNPVRDDARDSPVRERSSTTALTPTPTTTPTARDPDAHRSLSLDRRDTRRTNTCACSARTSW